MMYQNLKLEKGMYHITGKNFSEVLPQHRLKPCFLSPCTTE